MFIAEKPKGEGGGGGFSGLPLSAWIVLKKIDLNKV